MQCETTLFFGVKLGKLINCKIEEEKQRAGNSQVRAEEESQRGRLTSALDLVSCCGNGGRVGRTGAAPGTWGQSR